MMDEREPFVIEQGVLLKYRGGAEAAVPEGVVSIGKDAFRDCKSLVSVVLPRGLSRIGRGAFWGCSNLETVLFPDTLRTVEDWAFYDCAGLRSLLLPDGVEYLGECVFRGCVRLEEAVLPVSLEEIGLSAFEGCAALRRIRFPRELRRISDNAFRGCAGLSELALPDGLTGIGQRTFWGCSSLVSVRFPDGLETVGKDAFYYCTSLERVFLPDSLLTLGSCVFYGCGRLCDIRFPAGSFRIGRAAFAKTAWFESQPDGCVMAGSALYQYKGLMSDHTVLEIPQGTRTISEHAFCGCAGLERVSLPEGAVAVGDSAFEDCSSLRDVSFPKSLCEIGSRAFLRCGMLKSLALPSCVTAIGDEAFKSCSRLEDVPLPAGLRILGREVFFGCEAIKKFRLPADAAFYLAREGVLFSRSGKELVLYPPGRPDRSYAVPEGTERIREDAFSGVFRLRTLFLPGTLEALVPGTFAKASLQYVRLPRRIARLPAGVFRPETYVGVYYPDLIESTGRPVFLGGSIDMLPGKHRSAALMGFLFALRCGEDAVNRWRDSYTDYIRRNEPACARLAAQNEPLLHLMMEEGILSSSSLQALLSGAIGKERTDLTAELLAYQEKAFPCRPADVFSLDEEPRIRSALDAAKRRTELLQRSGIEGLRFAAAGRLRKFGFYSPQGAVDMSDLRSFMKKRGAELRYKPDGETDCLICNDPSAAPEPIARAASLGIPVITEDEFLKMASERPKFNYTGI